MDTFRAGAEPALPSGTFTNRRGQTVHAFTLTDFEGHDAGAKAGGIERRFLCPLPGCAGHQNPKTHRSLTLNTQTGLWNCKRCHAVGQLTDRWKPLETGQNFGKNGQAAKMDAFRRRMAGGLQTKSTQPMQPTQARPTPIIPHGIKSEAEAGYDWRLRMGKRVPLDGTPGAVYLEGRGLPAAFCHAAGVRFAVNFGSGGEAKAGRAAWAGLPAVLFCVKDAGGHSVAGQGRFIAPKGSMAKTLTFGPKAQGVFATPGALDGPIIVLTEAPIDALSLAVCGLPAVATCGTGTFPEWLRTVCAFKTVLLAQDADDGGDTDAGHVAHALRLTTPRVHRLRPEGAKDWNALLMAHGAEGLGKHLADALRDYLAGELGGRSCGHEHGAFMPQGIKEADKRIIPRGIKEAGGPIIPHGINAAASPPPGPSPTGTGGQDHAPALDIDRPNGATYRATHGVENAAFDAADAIETGENPAFLCHFVSSDPGFSCPDTVFEGQNAETPPDLAQIRQEIGKKQARFAKECEAADALADADADLRAQAAEVEAAFQAAEVQAHFCEQEMVTEALRRAAISELLFAARADALPVVAVRLGPGRISTNPNKTARALLDALRVAVHNMTPTADKPSPWPGWEGSAENALDDLETLALWWRRTGMDVV